jgi:soluble lytic murein transglycosylase-like protein
MDTPREALRLVLRPSSVIVTMLLVLAVVMAVRGDLETRPIVRLEVDTGGPVPPTPARATPSAATLTEYRVRPGDTLSLVAGLHHVTADAVARANDLSAPFALAAGDVLRIPDVAPSPPEPPPDTARTGLADLLGAWAEKVNLRADLLRAVAWRESSWRQDAVSDRGAVGVGQVLPETAGWISERLAGGVRLDPHVLDENVELSARYLRWLIDRYEGDVAAALAAYHQGPQAVDEHGWYPSTVQYVADIFRLRRSF